MGNDGVNPKIQEWKSVAFTWKLLGDVPSKRKPAQCLSQKPTIENINMTYIIHPIAVKLFETHGITLFAFVSLWEYPLSNAIR